VKFQIYIRKINSDNKISSKDLLIIKACSKYFQSNNMELENKNINDRVLLEYLASELN